MSLPYTLVEDADALRAMWVSAIVTWAHSQTARRAALRCADYEERAVAILCGIDPGTQLHRVREVAA